MREVLTLHIAGLGIIFYSPFAVQHILPGEDYLSTRFWEPADVASHVMECRLSAFGTGSPGIFELVVSDASPDEAVVQAASAAARLGIEVRDNRLCFRDLYDLMDWDPACPAGQSVALPDGFYRVTAYTSAPPSGLLGDHQRVWFHAEPSLMKPVLRWDGVPDLSADNE